MGKSCLLVFLFCLGFSSVRQQSPGFSAIPPFPFLSLWQNCHCSTEAQGQYCPIRHPTTMIPVLYNPLVSFCSALQRTHLRGDRHEGIDGKLWTVLTLYLSHNRHYFKTHGALAGSLPPLKGKKQLFLEAVWQNDIFAFRFLNLFSTGGLGDSKYPHLYG